MQRRRRGGRRLTYEQASSIARAAGCTSRKSFWDWWAAARPNNIPKMPNRVYTEWTTWGEFLGTTNVFSKYEKGSFRPYWEAVRWSQKFCIAKGLNTSLKWMHYYDAHEDEIPKDIPRNAQYHYKDLGWQGWPTWTGANLAAQVTVAQVGVAVFALATQPWTASNVVRVVVARDGMVELKAKLEAEQLKPLKAYVFNTEIAPQLQKTLEACGRGQQDGTFIIRDMNALMAEFDYLLEEVAIK